MKIKNVLLMGLSFVLIAAFAIGGTVAYLTDTDGAVNVLTRGNVSIKQIELERVNQTNSGEDELQGFTQGKPLVPSVGDRAWVESTSGRVYQQWPTGGSSALYDTKLANVIDKFVFVENDGKTNAYVRTVFAFEIGNMAYDRWAELVHLNINDTHWTWSDTYEVIEVNSVKYVMTSAVYTGSSTVHTNGILPSGATTRPSLLQYDFDKDATNEDFAYFGDTYEILVFSQAVQADMGTMTSAQALDEAFGAISTTNHPWVNPVTTVDELEAAIAAGATTVILDNNFQLNEVLEVNGELTIFGNGNTLTAPADGTRVVDVSNNTEEVTITLSGVTLDAADKERGISFYNNAGALDVTIVDSVIKAEHYGINVASNNKNATLTVKDSELSGFCAFQTWSANTIATFENCVLTGTNKWDAASGSFATIVVNEGATGANLTFNNCTVIADQESSATQYHLDDRTGEASVTWNNCTFIKNGDVVEAPIVKE